MSGLTPPLVDGLFPNGIAHYAPGSLLIGLGTAIIYLGTGVIAGASTSLESTLSYVFDLPRFSKAKCVASRDWRVMFTLSIVAGAALYTALFGDGWRVSDVQPWRFAVGGVLVGAGIRIGKGCTSGHGVCGVGSRSWTSLINVATFIPVAIRVAQLLNALGVLP